MWAKSPSEKPQHKQRILSEKPISFFSDLKNCLNRGGFPTPDQLPDLSVREMLAAVDEIHDAAENAGVDTFEKLAALVSAGTAGVGLSEAAIEIITHVAAVAGMLAISVYLGAALTCSADIVFHLHLQGEVASAEPGFAKQQLEVALNAIDPNLRPRVMGDIAFILLE